MTTHVTIEVLTVEELAPALAKHFCAQPPAWQSGPAPAVPGTYVWTAQASGEAPEAVLYIGSAASLHRRLSNYAGWIDGYDPEEGWEVSVIHLLKQSGAVVRWLPTTDHAEALILESRLIEWHRTEVGIAPIVTGWNAKKRSRREESQTWARDLWNERASVV
ncbi:hypothetical protein KZZ52_41905 [Dactylosporangium sp. AC04546]|uniref:hypothetical protein n=1 Tax=Dactylosporangium sp. AC04546 TaxID=2862460 RepID=UPI001EE09EE5|nr:hypothetical protein [Dactylosporangium sp. AC04546]WVK80481.1 hypothetical protein KZZ52_41905 [Dactylosporangium sp. AC04546]